jgi:cation transport ATPase
VNKPCIRQYREENMTFEKRAELIRKVTLFVTVGSFVIWKLIEIIKKILVFDVWAFVGSALILTIVIWLLIEVFKAEKNKDERTIYIHLMSAYGAFGALLSFGFIMGIIINFTGSYLLPENILFFSKIIFVLTVYGVINNLLKKGSEKNK